MTRGVGNTTLGASVASLGGNESVFQKRFLMGLLGVVALAASSEAHAGMIGADGSWPAHTWVAGEARSIVSGESTPGTWTEVVITLHTLRAPLAAARARLTVEATDGAKDRPVDRRDVELPSSGVTRLHV